MVMERIAYRGKSAEVDLTAIDRIEKGLKDIAHVLSLMDEGSFGLCKVCGAPIDLSILEQAPTSTECSIHRFTRWR
ncbi:MAG: hypothetical protein M1131_07350 [Actinobacteria bacterium]|jgi:RNA polymerase-binding transcription factor DksA|nr:hypothetical protein [Actinomycetota bacterium]